MPFFDLFPADPTQWRFLKAPFIKFDLIHRAAPSVVAKKNAFDAEGRKLDQMPNNCAITRHIKRLAALWLMVSIIALPSAFAPAQAAEPANQTFQEEPKAILDFGKMLVYQRCGNCHGLEPGDDRFAAPLNHLFGRKPGTIDGFTFSSNLKGIGTPWTPSTLDNWLAQTTFDTPDIRMRHVGIVNLQQRQAVIAYLKTLPGNSSATK